MERSYETFVSWIVEDLPELAKESPWDLDDGCHFWCGFIGEQMVKQILENEHEAKRMISIINNFYLNGDHGIKNCIMMEIYYELRGSQFLFDWGKKHICPEALNHVIKYTPIRYGGQGASFVD
jgi:hypothetical protein